MPKETGSVRFDSITLTWLMIPGTTQAELIIQTG
jgi:hypothetical protein